MNERGERATVRGTWKIWAGNDGAVDAVEVIVA